MLCPGSWTCTCTSPRPSRGPTWRQWASSSPSTSFTKRYKCVYCVTIAMFWEFGRGSEYGIHPIAHGTNASHQCKLSNTAAVCIVSHNTRSSAAPRATSASAALVLSNFDIGIKYIFLAKIYICQELVACGLSNGEQTKVNKLKEHKSKDFWPNVYFKCQKMEESIQADGLACGLKCQSRIV